MIAVGIQPDEVIMNTLINANAQAKNVEGASRLVVDMMEMGLSPNEVTLSSIINAHAKVQDVDGAHLVLKNMESLGFPNEIAMNTVINAHAQANDVNPDLARQACCGLANLAEMMENQNIIMRNGGCKLLIKALDNPSVLVRREASR